eukprot:TRINITY_DN33578_c0_g2_i1.p1 TRINITY_DN33578_c0_g2~~TRINITY_DN33578_c0_g2_i1.p1  ORF type:complete len:589 (-),score=80.45 TRINITY_DN33578_c0_g2_i1:456-2222(-)
MRLRFVLDLSLRCASDDHGDGSPIRTMLGIPESLTHVSDLSHFLHGRFSLIRAPLVLKVQGFALMPCLRFQDVLRETDIIEVVPASIPNDRERLSQHRHTVTQTQNKRRKQFPAVLDAPSQASMLALPMPPLKMPPPTSTPLPIKMAPAKAPIISNVLAESIPATKRGSEVASMASSDGQPTAKRQRHKKAKRDDAASQAALPALPYHVSRIDVDSLVTTPIAANTRVSAPFVEQSGNGSRDGIGNITNCKSIFGDDGNRGGWPDASRPEIWQPIAREPAPWEIVRFRVAGEGRHGGLSDFRTARCVGFEMAPEGSVYVLIGENAVIERLPVHRLLQLAVPKSGNLTWTVTKTAAEACGCPPALTDVLPSQPDISATLPSVEKAVPATEDDAACIAASATHGCHGSIKGDLGDRDKRMCDDDSDASSSLSSRKSLRPSGRHRVGASTAPMAAVMPASSSSSAAATQAMIEMATSRRTAAVLSSCRRRVEDGGPFLGAQMSPEELFSAVRSQLEFYFGDNSYPKDRWLQAQADFEGWTSLRLVSKFNRMRELTRDHDFVVRCAQDSPIVEVSDCRQLIRRRNLRDVISR